jgi:hypothetical protein
MNNLKHKIIAIEKITTTPRGFLPIPENPGEEIDLLSSPPADTLSSRRSSESSAQAQAFSFELECSNGPLPSPQDRKRRMSTILDSLQTDITRKNRSGSIDDRVSACRQRHQVQSSLTKQYYINEVIRDILKALPELAKNMLHIRFHRLQSHSFSDDSEYSAPMISGDTDFDFNIVVGDEFAETMPAIYEILLRHQQEMQSLFSIELEVEDFTVRTVSQVLEAQQTEAGHAFYLSIAAHHENLFNCPEIHQAIFPPDLAAKEKSPVAKLFLKNFDRVHSISGVVTYRPGLATPKRQIGLSRHIGAMLATPESWEIDLKTYIRFYDLYQITQDFQALDEASKSFIINLQRLTILRDMLEEQSEKGSETTVLTCDRFAELMRQPSEKQVLDELFFGTLNPQQESVTGIIPFPGPKARQRFIDTYNNHITAKKYKEAGYMALRRVDRKCRTIQAQLVVDVPI